MSSIDYIYPHNNYQKNVLETSNHIKNKLENFIGERNRKLLGISLSDNAPFIVLYQTPDELTHSAYFAELTGGCAYLICSNSTDDLEFLHNLRMYVAEIFNYSAILVTDTSPTKINKYLEMGYEKIDARVNQRTGNHITMLLCERK